MNEERRKLEEAREKLILGYMDSQEKMADSFSKGAPWIIGMIVIMIIINMLILV